MNRKRNKVNIVYAGRFSDSGILSGPELTAKSIFNQHCLKEPSVFIQYYFDGRKYSLIKKLFGRTEKPVLNEVNLNNGKVLTLGIFRIIPELRKIKPDIIHLLTFERFAIIFYLYSLLFRVKIIYNSHGVIQYENKILKKVTGIYRVKDKFCERIFLKYSDKVIFPSVNTLNIAEKYYYFDEESVVILPNGIDNIFFSKKEKTETAKRLRAVIHHKNTLNDSGIKQLFDTLATTDIQLDIHIITNTELKLPENDKINFIITGIMGSNELADFYKDKDIFLSLNSYDTFSIATAEAMASGLIPVITSETGISRYIDNAVNGFTFDYHLKTELLKIINTIIGMRIEQRYDISNAAAYSIESLTWQNIYEMYEPLYNSMIK